MFSSYPEDPRPRRAAEALLKEGASVDVICLATEASPKHEISNGIDVRRIAVKHRRGGKLAYAYQYVAFILISATILALRSLKRRYDLVYVHNMPDVLVLSALIPKAMGARVILDQHDPMPELMTTIFGLGQDSLSVRLIKRLEKWSLGRANLVLTVNIACKRIFASRSCTPAKIGVVMNSPDEEIFPFRISRSQSATNQAPNGPFVIMYHGSLVERNGLDVAVEGLARVLKSVPAAELRIFGAKTAFLERVMELPRGLGIEGAVRYFGPKRLEELVWEIEKCHVGIIPNQRNAFTEINTPTRIFEYLAMGKPVIAPSTPGILDYFTEDSLLFFEAGESADIARQIEYVARNYQEAIQIAERGQHIYLQHTWKQERKTLVALVSGLFSQIAA
jgi:glycosyltransferase involved in cell wall biosynthesis